MKLKSRLLLIGLGIFFGVAGVARWHQYGVFPYPNDRMQPVFPAGVMMIGVFFVLLALTPGDWVFRRLKDKPPKARVLRSLHRNRQKRPAKPLI